MRECERDEKKRKEEKNGLRMTEGMYEKVGCFRPWGSLTLCNASKKKNVAMDAQTVTEAGWELCYVPYLLLASMDFFPFWWG